MAKGRELVGRIKSTENTRKITRTMEMVSASKMKRAMDRVIAARPYATALGDVISSLYNPELAESFPLADRRVTLANHLAHVDPVEATVIDDADGLAGITASHSHNLQHPFRRLVFAVVRHLQRHPLRPHATLRLGCFAHRR
jgi:hypothetical protein